MSAGRKYHEVVQTIRSALNAEIEQRPSRTLDTWILAERDCVLREVNLERRTRGYDPASRADVERVERTAVGHSDYVMKFACAAADLAITAPETSRCPRCGFTGGCVCTGGAAY